MHIPRLRGDVFLVDQPCKEDRSSSQLMNPAAVKASDLTWA